MTIAPASLQEMIASTRLEDLRNAVVAELARLLKGVTVKAHPGKLDINEVVEKAIVAAPGVAVGWTRVREIRDLDQDYGLGIDLVAYIVTEDFPDRTVAPPRLIDRAVVAMAIGTQILAILADEDTATWGMARIAPPSTDPAPELRPVFTMKAGENRTAIHVVTWVQMLVREGRSPFGGAAPRVAGLPDGMAFELPEGDLPAELLAVFGREGQP